MSRRIATLLLSSLCLLAGCDALVSTQHRVERARAALDSGNVGVASIELQKALKREPQNADVRVLLARLALIAGDAGTAERELDAALKSGARPESIAALRAEVLLASGKAAAVEAAIRGGKLILPEPDRSIALARACDILGKPDCALDALKPVFEGNSVPMRARTTRAEALALRGESDAAIAELDKAIAEDAVGHEALLLKGTLLLKRGQYAAAESALRLAVQRMHPTTPMPERAFALAALTETALVQGNIQNAVTSHATLAKLTGDSPVAMVLGARIKLAQGDYSAAIADLGRVVAANPDFLQARMLLGAAHFTQGNLSQAEAQLAAVVQRAGDNLEARKLLARVRLQLDQPDAALRTLTPALDTDSADPQLYALLGTARLRSGDSNAAVEALERGVKANPTDANLTLDLARVYLASDRARDALSLLQDHPGTEPDPRRDALFVAALTAARGPLGARTEIEKLVAAQPKDVRVLNLAAVFFSARLEFERARGLLRDALLVDGKNVSTLLNLARLDAARGDRAAAETSLTTALAVAPANTQVRIALADFLMRRGAYADAQRTLEAGMGKTADVPLQLALAQLNLARGQVPAANAAFEKLVAAQPNDAELVNQIGVLLLDGRQYDAALARFRRAAELAPKNASYWVNVARAQLAMDQSVPARESLEKALAVQPNWAPAIAALVQIDLRAKNYESARARVASLLAARRDDPEVLLLKGDVEQASGAYQEAATVYARAQQLRPSAVGALKLFQLRRGAGLPKPEEPLQQWLAMQPADFRIRQALASYYLQGNDLKRAAAELEQIEQQLPSSAATLNNLAWVYWQLGDARAESIADRAYRIAPNTPAIADTFGWILANKNATERALPLLESAARAAGADPEIQYHYAYVLAKAGRRSEAREILSRVLAAAAHFPARAAAERLKADL